VLHVELRRFGGAIPPCVVLSKASKRASTFNHSFPAGRTNVPDLPPALSIAIRSALPKLTSQVGGT